MTNINTILKNRKNKKGFSLIELIVVLVIMAILAAALVPSLIGYINQSRQNNAINECASVVSAAQTIVSSAYADPDGEYNSNNGNGSFDPTVAANDATFKLEIVALSEATGTIGAITISSGVVTGVTYTANNGTVVTYASGTYST